MRVPFINFFDGFRTSHEIQKIAIGTMQTWPKCATWTLSGVQKESALNPGASGNAADRMKTMIYFFQHREACKNCYEAVPGSR